MLYVGMDHHVKRSSLAVLNEDGKRIWQGEVKGDTAAVVSAVRELGARYLEPVAVCFEASCGSGHLYDELAAVSRRVVVAHPGRLHLIFKSKRKNDRVDAQKLALLLLTDQVPEVYVPSGEVRDWRQLIVFRCHLVAKRTRVKNEIRSLLLSQGVKAPSRLWTKAGRQWLEGLSWPRKALAFKMGLLLSELTEVQERLRELERYLNAQARRHPGVELLQTIPGFGRRVAEAVMAYIDQPGRFPNSRVIGSYFGLVPSQDQSGSRNRLGHITKQGPSVVRGLLTEAAWMAVRKSATVRAYYEKRKGMDPDRKKIALIATAHYLLRVSLSMLKSGECWRESA